MHGRVPDTGGTRTRRVLGLTQLAVVGLAGLTALSITCEARACSPALRGWQPSVATYGPETGIAITLGCFDGCDPTPAFDVSVRDGEGEVSGAVVESEFRTSAGWLVWKPEAPLTVGTSYEVSLTGASEGAELWRSTYQVTEAGAVLSAAHSPVFEAIGFVEFLGGEECCEEGLRDSCGGSPRCFPDRSSARARVSVQALWSEADWNPAEVRLGGEFFTAHERRVVEPRVGTWLGAQLAPTDAVDAYCYKITANNLLTDESRLFEGCVAAAAVELPDAQAERLARNRSIALGCTVPSPKYEALFCDAYSAQVATQTCETEVREEPCQNALALCTPPEPAASSQPESSCALLPGASRSAPWALGVLAAMAASWMRRRGARPC